MEFMYILFRQKCCRQKCLFSVGKRNTIGLLRALYTLQATQNIDKTFTENIE